MTEIEIVELYWDRDQTAISQTAAQYGNYCYSIAKGILLSPEDCEECLNDTWFRAWETIPPQRPSKLSVFLGMLTRNIALDRYRRSTAQKRKGAEVAVLISELDECTPSTSNVEHEVFAIELEHIVNKYLDKLPERECNIFLLRYWYNKSVREIGERYSMKDNNVKVSLHRSREKLKAYLEKEGVSQ